MILLVAEKIKPNYQQWRFNPSKQNTMLGETKPGT